MDPTQFFGIPSPGLDAADALILPWPLEKTVSYGTGTHSGPGAIIAASRQIELFEEETLIDFEERPRLHTLAAIEVDAAHARRPPAGAPGRDRPLPSPAFASDSSSRLAASTC